MNWESNGEMWWAAYGPVELRIVSHKGQYQPKVYGYSGRSKQLPLMDNLESAQHAAVEAAKDWFYEATL